MRKRWAYEMDVEESTSHTAIQCDPSDIYPTTDSRAVKSAYTTGNLNKNKNAPEALPPAAEALPPPPPPPVEAAVAVTPAR